jgi:hypothetical protein
MAPRAEAQVLPDIMLATGTTDDVMYLKVTPTIRLRPPAHRATAV